MRRRYESRRPEQVMTALFLVRAEVADSRDREAFDLWYQDEHLPQAAEVLSAVRAWLERCRCFDPLRLLRASRP